MCRYLTTNELIQDRTNNVCNLSQMILALHMLMLFCIDLVPIFSVRQILPLTFLQYIFAVLTLFETWDRACFEKTFGAKSIKTESTFLRFKKIFILLKHFSYFQSNCLKFKSLGSCIKTCEISRGFHINQNKIKNNCKSLPIQ